MKKFVFLLAYIVIAVLMASCEIDNYAEPDGRLTGRIIDAVTGQPLITEQPSGFRIWYKEISWDDDAQTQGFWGKADGTFNNTKLFAGTYLINAIEGPFPDPLPQMARIESGKMTTVEFTVTPYISFSDLSIVREDERIRATFTLSKNVPEATLQNYRIFATKATPYVGVEMFDSEVSTGEVTITESDMDIPVSVLLPANFTAGKTYYVRVGARCQNPQNRYNMTEIVTIQM
jgi:hypothetical protein